MADIRAYLDRLQIDYQCADHPPVRTCEEAQALAPGLPGMPTKNLFLRDRRGRRHFLVVVPQDQEVDLRELAGLLETRGLSMASAERLQRHLGVEPGAVTLLGLVHDESHAVELVVDTCVWDAHAWQCHPLVNTATLVLDRAGVMRFLESTGHLAGARHLAVPAPPDSMQDSP